MLKVTLCTGRVIQELVEFEHGRYYVIAARDRCMTHDDTGQCSPSCVQVPVWSFIDVPASRSASWIPSKLQIEFRGHQVAGYETMWGAVQAVEWLDRQTLQA